MRLVQEERGRHGAQCLPHRLQCVDLYRNNTRIGEALGRGLVPWAANTTIVSSMKYSSNYTRCQDSDTGVAGFVGYTL